MVSFPIPIQPGCPFTLEHFPFGIFSTVKKPSRRVGTAVGDYIVDLSVLEGSSFLDDAGLSDLEGPFGGSPFSGQDDLSSIARLNVPVRTQLRRTLKDWLSDASSPIFTDETLFNDVLVSMVDATMHLPFKIPNFTDFMCADVHVDNCSRLAGGVTPPSHFAMPLGYNGRASSVVIQDEPVHRPHGIVRDPQSSSISFRPSEKVDYEAEIGFFVSKSLPRGRTITADEAGDYIFGFVTMNDWSARDIQFTEMTPLGPFNGKAFATTISPWVTTVDVLVDFKCRSTATDLREGGTSGAPHLRHRDETSTWDLQIEVSVLRPKWKTEVPLLTSRANLRDLRWSPGQMLSHLVSSGCGLSTGDLIGSGTISSPNDAPSLRTLGCLFELTAGGKNSLGSSEESITFLEDGDKVAISVWNSSRTVGLGPLSVPLVGCSDN